MQRENRKAKRGPRRGSRRKPRGNAIRVIESRRNPSFPGQNNVKPKVQRSFRYYDTAGSANVSVTGRCLLNLVLATNTATTLAVNVYEAVKIDRVCMYFVPSSVDGLGTSSAELTLNWRGDRSPDTRFSDRGTSTHPSCIKARPPFMSLAGYWITNFSQIDQELFELTCPGGTVIDILLTMTIGDGATRSVTLTAAAANTGIGYAHLDNAITAGTVGPRGIAPDSLTLVSILTP